MMQYAIWFLLISGVLFVIVGAWVAVYFWLVPYLNRPDGQAVVQGHEERGGPKRSLNGERP